MLAGLMKGGRHVFTSQTPQSIRAWGDLRGESVLDTTRRMQTPEVLELVTLTVERAADTRQPQRVVVPFIGGEGSVTFLAAEGLMFSNWKWLREPITTDPRASLLLEAEHLERLAWCLRTGRPLPHLPAALRPSRPAGPPAP